MFDLWSIPSKFLYFNAEIQLPYERDEVFLSWVGITYLHEAKYIFANKEMVIWYIHAKKLVNYAPRLYTSLIFLGDKPIQRYF